MSDFVVHLKLYAHHLKTILFITMFCYVGLHRGQDLIVFFHHF